MVATSPTRAAPRHRMPSEDGDFRILVDNAPGFVAVVEAGRLVFVNRAAFQMLAARLPSDLIGRTLSSFIHPEFRPLLLDDAATLRGERGGTAIKMIRLDGIVIDVELAAMPVHFDGRSGLAFFASDRTTVVQAIDALRAREERIVKILDTVIDGVITIDAGGVIESFNKAAETIFGVAAECVIGEQIDPLLRTADGGPTAIELVRSKLGAPPEANMASTLELLRDDNDAPFVAEVSISELHHQGRRLYTMILRDVTESKRFEQRLEQIALYDTLTGLPNRASLLKRLDTMASEYQTQGRRGVVLLFDVDRFKNVNDFFGHGFGDRLIQAVAERLSAILQPFEFLARLPGDEFVIVKTSTDPRIEIDRLVQRLTSTLTRPFVIDEFELFVTASMGAVIYPDHAADAAEILKNVESATYFAKDKGRNNCQVYSDRVSEGRAGRLDMETELRKAMQSRGLSLVFQPRIDTLSGKVTGMEALARWVHPRLGSISPTRFIPIAEETGMIVQIGDLVLRAACVATKNWLDQGYAPLRVSVNLSTRQFRDASLPARIAAVLKRTGLPPECLEIEITESGLMFEIDQVMEILADLKTLGVSVAVDDFGMGYSSLSYLKRFPIDVLKIDQSFIQGVPNEPGDVAISTAIVAMSKSLQLRVVAEGVETIEQLNFVRGLGCDEIQGYHFSRPLTAEDFSSYLDAQRRAPIALPGVA